jgi:hypothetical protein
MKNLFETLCAKAREEESPQVDIAGRTIAFIKTNEIQIEWFWDKPLMWVAALSSAAAVSIVIIAVMLHNMWNEPLFEISQMISWAM